MRQHVLLFDEFYDEHETFQWQRVISGAAGADLLFVGTSFAVGVTDLFLRAAIERRVPTFSIDPGLPMHLTHKSLGSRTKQKNCCRA